MTKNIDHVLNFSLQLMYASKLHVSWYTMALSTYYALAQHIT